MEKFTLNKDYFANARVGLFTHYTYATYTSDENYGGTAYSQNDSRNAASAEEAAALFDGEKFAKAAYDLGAEYVVFTLCHAGFNLLYPSPLMRSLCPHKCTEKSDAIQKLIDGLSQYNIPLVLYLPPNDECDLTEEDQKKLGLFEDHEGKAEFLKRLISEIYERYKNKIAGFWFDQYGPKREVCDHVRACNPDAVVFVNMGKTATPVRHPNSDFIVSEYYGSIESCDSDTLPVHYSQVNRQIGNWWANGGKAPTDARNLYRYTVRTIAVEGQQNCGIAWSCGPYLDQSWEDGVRELMSEIGGLLRSHRGIYGTVPGRSYVEAPNSVLEKDMWGVSTESPDGSIVYLHVLNRPENGVLCLPMPADGKIFTSAKCGDILLDLQKNADGYTVTMPAQDDGIDTVIELSAEKTESITVRRYTDADLDAMISIWNEVVRDDFAFPQEEQLTLKTGAAFFAEQTYTAVACDRISGEVCGLYILHPNNIGRCSHICNASFAVASAKRGLHIGEKLVLDCLKMGKACGFTVLQFNAVVASNSHARHLYERLGFKQLGVIPKGFRMNGGKYEDICPYYREL